MGEESTFRPEMHDSTTAKVRQRLSSHLYLKLGLAVFLNLWALVPFFFLQHRILFQIHRMPFTFVDRWIPFDDRAVGLYLSLFLLMPMGPLLMVKRSDLLRYGLGVAMMSLTANTIFFLLPTAFPRPDVPQASMLYAWLTSRVTPLNDFPSLHAAMTLYSALCCDRVLRQVTRKQSLRLGTWVWSVAVIYATLAIKEHLAVDALGGAMLGVASYYFAFNAIPKGQTAADGRGPLQLKIHRP
jgi:membrane-associated phospholipid phosphatase